MVRSSTKRDAILAGALQEFLAKGYAGASMDRITRAAGVSKSTLYAYFQDKESLFLALIDAIAKDKLRLIFRLQELDTQHQDPRAALRQVAEMMLARVTEDPHIVAFMRLLIFEAGRFPKLGQTFINTVEKPSIEALSQYLADCPAVRITDPEAAARIFIGTLVYFAITQEGMYGKEIIPIATDRIVDALMQSLILSDPE